jgi:hypothetical protein
MLKQRAADQAMHPVTHHHANLRSLVGLGIAGTGDLQSRKAVLERAQHVLQFGEFAGAINLGDSGINSFGSGRDRLAEIDTMPRRKSAFATRRSIR